MMPATDTPPDTDTKAAAVAWLTAERAAGRDPSNDEIANRFGVSDRTVRNYRKAVREAEAEGSDAEVVPIHGKPPGNGTAPEPRSAAPSAPAPGPVPATPTPVAAATPAETVPEGPRRAAAPVPATGKGPERKAPPATPAPRPATRPAPAPVAAEPRQPAHAPAAGPLTAKWWDRAVILVGLTAVRLLAAAVSYGHMRHLAYEAGQTGRLGWFTVADVLPLTVDGLAVLALVTRRLRRRQGLPADPATEVALYLAVAVSLAANIQSSWGSLLSVAVGVWAPVVLFVGEAVEKPTGAHKAPRETSEKESQ